nr:cyclin B protein [Sipunculus nudus]
MAQTAVAIHLDQGQLDAGMNNKSKKGRALGTISNSQMVHRHLDGKKAGTNQVLKKSLATRSIASENVKKDVRGPECQEKPVSARFAIPELKKENASKPVMKQQDAVEVVELRPATPPPMDMSVDAYSTNQLVKDIDKDDFTNPQLVSEYVNEIYDYLRELEEKYSIQQDYLKGTELNARMRGILIDWLVQVHMRFRLLQETLYLTVAIIDRFLQESPVSRGKLQLVGVTAMFIAAKYEEMYAPEIADFVYITDNAYNKSEIRKMERLMLHTLDFSLGRPLPLHFLRRNSKAGEVDAMKHQLAKYLMELTLVEYSMAHIPPSKIAAASLCISMKVLDSMEWDPTLIHYSKYSETELRPVMQQIATLVLKAGKGKLTAIKTKYQSSKFMKISVIEELQSPVLKELAESSAS